MVEIAAAAGTEAPATTRHEAVDSTMRPSAEQFGIQQARHPARDEVGSTELGDARIFRPGLHL